MPRAGEQHPLCLADSEAVVGAHTPRRRLTQDVVVAQGGAFDPTSAQNQKSQRKTLDEVHHFRFCRESGEQPNPQWSSLDGALTAR
jgi:hypothetical protein